MNVASPADGIRPVLLRQRTISDGTGPRVLLLHGMADSATVWERLLALAPRHAELRRAEIHTAELPWRGTGPSDWAHRLDSAAWLAETLDELADTVGPADVVVAHSFSAMLLLDLACGASARTGLAGRPLQGMLLLSPFFRPRPEDFDWHTMAGLPEQFVRTMEEGIRVAAGPRSKPELHRALAERLCETIGPYGWSRFFELYLRTPWLRTTEVRTPVLVVSGAEDRIAVPGEAQDLVARMPSAALHTIEETGHFPMAERPARFADALGGFLRRIRATPEAAGERPRSTLMERI
ncbi:alpha/beta fold hydrolase [Streptomyces sp. NRRL S-920]|uniref:alpha/beta fold hydrolase n=1 Tax=Streptomyces sp. NRRL S-920 TaxID=1463921 RepID=UPI00068F3C46|nr:alpha/beta hydrolase [Streptomyces sp. NRRL S-920]